MELKRTDIVKNILGKGFEPDTRPNPDHDFYYLKYKGKESHIFVKISRGKEYREYREPVLKIQARTWGVTFRDVVRFFNCENDYEDLVAALIRSGKLDP
jgi:hypothetical protein